MKKGEEKQEEMKEDERVQVAPNMEARSIRRKLKRMNKKQKKSSSAMKDSTASQDNG